MKKTDAIPFGILDINVHNVFSRMKQRKDIYEFGKMIKRLFNEIDNLNMNHEFIDSKCIPSRYLSPLEI
jgi:hypothetical protein